MNATIPIEAHEALAHALAAAGYSLIWRGPSTPSTLQPSRDSVFVEPSAKELVESFVRRPTGLAGVPSQVPRDACGCRVDLLTLEYLYTARVGDRGEPFGSLRVSAITPDIAARVRQQARRGSAVASAAFTWAVRRDLLAVNPFERRRRSRPNGGMA
jgi:hypothetical protein